MLKSRKIEKNEKIRLIVLTDISSLCTDYGEPDDTQSLIRLLLYSDCFDIEGLIATYTEHVQGCVKTDYIHAVLKAYGKVRETLCCHSPDYPTEEYLQSCVKAGNPKCGMDEIGKEKDTEGSDWIIDVVDRPDPRPIWITVWGGVTDLAQALWRVKNERDANEWNEFCSKLYVYAVGDQYDQAGPWIRANCPKVHYITSYHSFRGMYRDGRKDLVNREWVETHICNGHGSLGEMYPNYDGGDIWGHVAGVKEGDSPSFLYLIPNGLGNPYHPDWGSWGGRFEKKDGTYVDAQDQIGELEKIEREETDYTRNIKERAAVFRFRQAYQNSFQARLDWCIQPYGNANHEPIVKIKGNRELNVYPGEQVILDASETWDPDGDPIHFRWWIYKEAGTYSGTVALVGKTTKQLTIRIPEGGKPGTIHVLLEVTDEGEPSLTSYQRIVVTVLEKKKESRPKRQKER